MAGTGGGQGGEAKFGGQAESVWLKLLGRSFSFLFSFASPVRQTARLEQKRKENAKRKETAGEPACSNNGKEQPQPLPCKLWWGHKLSFSFFSLSCSARASRRRKRSDLPYCCYTAYPDWFSVCVLLFGVTQCNYVLLMSSNCVIESSIGCLDIIKIEMISLSKILHPGEIFVAFGKSE